VKITVRVKSRAKENKVIIEDAAHYAVYIHAPATEGKANEALIRVLADHFDIAQSRIRIVSGFSSRIKIVDIQ